MSLYRRARPTLHLLREDLDSGWADPAPLRGLANGDLRAPQPLSDLPHPIIAKAAESFGETPDDDNFVGPIHCAKGLDLKEIRAEQWRGGVWVDDENICWPVAAGLAKQGPGKVSGSVL